MIKVYTSPSCSSCKKVKKWFLDNDIPVKKILEDENIFVMDENRSNSQDIRPLDILILNLMPLKEDTELALLRSLSNTPLQVNVTFIRTLSYESKHASKQHIERFYSDFPTGENGTAL